MKRLSLAVCVLLMSVNAMADTQAYMRREAWGEKSYPAAPHIVEQASFEPAITLSAEGALDQLEAIRQWNAAGHLPARGGFVREIPDGMSVMVRSGVASKSASALERGVVATTDHGTTVWGTSVRVLGADRLRLRLDDVKLPAGTTLWVYGDNGKTIAFDAALIDVNGGIWTPSVAGNTVHLEMELPATRESQTASFSMHRVIQLVPLSNAIGKPNDDASCLIDANCVTSSDFSGIEIARHAIGHIEIPVGGGFVNLCTGGLVNDSRQSGTPFFLTAAHCFGNDSNPAAHLDQVAGMEVYFEFRSDSCNAASFTVLPQVVGATLLASNTTADYAFFKLNSIPANRGFLGFSSQTVTAGTNLFRISHPAPDAKGGNPQPQVFTQTRAISTGPLCQGLDRGTFLYEQLIRGATYGGSSGSPLMNSSTQVVGQLNGKCGPTPKDGCDASNSTTDGAFAPQFDSVYKQFLQPATGGGVCTPTNTTICLNNNRFSVSVQFVDGGVTKDATAIKYTDASGLFWFFGPDNIEILVKVLNGCFIQTYWVFSAATTDREFHMTVVDTNNGQVKRYDNIAGKPAPAVTDTSAFRTCP